METATEACGARTRQALRTRARLQTQLSKREGFPVGWRKGKMGAADLKVRKV